MARTIVVPRDMRVKDPVTDQVLREHRAAVVSLGSLPFVKTNTVTVVFTAGATPVVVKHGLPGRVTGYMVVRASAALTVYDSAPIGADHVEDLWIQASAAGTVTLFVYQD